MAGWLYEVGIGEERAIRVENGAIVAAAIAWPTPLRAGAVVAARLTSILAKGQRGIVRAAEAEALIEPVPAGVTEGAALRVEVLRETLPEPGRAKLARVRATAAPLRQGMSLRERIGASDRADPRLIDRFEAAGWSEFLEQAVSGDIDFSGGSLRMSLTPAMTLFDVDGAIDPPALAVAGAAAAAHAICRFGIGGSIGIDLPTLVGKADRAAAAAAVDAILPQPFERTAVNGFGFLQIVRRRVWPSIPELIQADPVGAAARALLRRAERVAGSIAITAAPVVAQRLERETGWMEELARRAGGAVTLSADSQLAIWGGHVHNVRA